MQVIPTKYACGRPVHRSNQVSLWPKPNSIRLDRVAEFQTHIPPNIRVKSDVLGNWLTGSELSVYRVKHHKPSRLYLKIWVWPKDVNMNEA